MRVSLLLVYDRDPFADIQGTIPPRERAVLAVCTTEANFQQNTDECLESIQCSAFVGFVWLASSDIRAIGAASHLHVYDREPIADSQRTKISRKQCSRK
jgi:hypothetical protein